MLLSSKKIIFNVALECHPPVVFALQQWTQWKAKTNSTFNCWFIDKTGRENKCQVQPRALRQSAFTIIIVREVIRFRLVQVWKSRSWTLIMFRLSWNASECRDKMFLHEEKKKPASAFCQNCCISYLRTLKLPHIKSSLLSDSLHRSQTIVNSSTDSAKRNRGSSRVNKSAEAWSLMWNAICCQETGCQAELTWRLI